MMNDLYGGSNAGRDGTKFQPEQAAINVSHDIGKLLEDRLSNSGSVLGSNVSAGSVQMNAGEIAVYDVEAMQVTPTPATFTSLTRVPVDRTKGQCAFEQRFRYAGIVITPIDFHKNSQLHDAKVTLQIHGLCSVRWRSPTAVRPMLGDWIKAYMPDIDDQKREVQLRGVAANSVGVLYPGEIQDEYRIPVLTKRFDVTDILHLPQRAMTLFCEDPKKYSNMIARGAWDRSLPQTPEVETLLNVLAAPVRMSLRHSVGTPNYTAAQVEQLFLEMNAEFAVSPIARSAVMKAMVGDIDTLQRQHGFALTYIYHCVFNSINEAQTKVIGKVAKPTILGDLFGAVLF